MVNSNIPFLIEFDLLDKYKIIVNNIEKILHFLKIFCKAPLARKRSHIHLEWETHYKILYTYSELFKVHRNFSHQSTG